MAYIVCVGGGIVSLRCPHGHRWCCGHHNTEDMPIHDVLTHIITNDRCDGYRESESDEDGYPNCWRCGLSRTAHIGAYRA